MERGLICNQRTVLAIQAGATQTRVPMKKQPKYVEVGLSDEANPGDIAIEDGRVWVCSSYSVRIPDAIKWRYARSPFGVPGDRLYVKTKFKIWNEPHFNRTWLTFPTELGLQGKSLTVHGPIRYKNGREMADGWHAGSQLPRYAAPVILLVKRVWVEQTEGVWEWCCEYEKLSDNS